MSVHPDRRLGLCVGYFFWALSSAVSSGQEPAHADWKFELLPAIPAGIDFIHTDGQSGQHFITETVTGGLATLDFDLDGRQDIVFTNATDLSSSNSKVSSALYRNFGGWRFQNVSQTARTAGNSCGMGVTVADYDSDGLPDILVTSYGYPTLYSNNGDGTFVDTTNHSRLHRLSFGAGACFFDADNDGDLDLYLANYVDFSVEKNKTRHIAGYEFAVGPNDYPPQHDFFYLNNGDGTFIDESQRSGVDQLYAPGMGVFAADFDQDGDIDVFVCNDQMPNFLMLNDGEGSFVDDALLAGVAFDASGKSNGNMGIDLADFNGDGLFDLVTTTYQEEMPVVYAGVESGLFVDRTQAVGISRELFNHVSWGVIAADFNIDGNADIFLATGHFLPNLAMIDDRTGVRVKNFLFSNRGNFNFDDVTDRVLPRDVRSSRGAVAEDFDGDGDLDIVILNANDSPSLLRNNISDSFNRLRSVRLVGTKSNRDAVGAIVEVSRDNHAKIRWVRTSSRGYESSWGHCLTFGVSFDEVVQLKVRWPSGITESFDVESSSTLVEGDGTPE